MSSARTKIVVLTAAVALTVVGLRYFKGPSASSSADATDADQLDGRFWVEGRPDKLTEYVHGTYFFSRANFGVFRKGSEYDIRIEYADVSRKGETLKVFFPQTKKSAETKFTVKACSDKPPFDLCLDFAENPWGGPKRYYGFEHEEDERANLGAVAAEMRDAKARHDRALGH